MALLCVLIVRAEFIFFTTEMGVSLQDAETILNLVCEALGTHAILAVAAVVEALSIHNCINDARHGNVRTATPGQALGRCAPCSPCSHRGLK